MAGGARCGNERAAVKTAPIVPARIVSDDDGTPRSADYGDIYHPRSGALAQARHVFLDGAALAARWRNRARFVVLETGFGLGNNFLATWSAWRADPGRSRQLHFISIEQAPPTRATIASIGRDAVLAPLADELGRRWPPLTCNLHRLAFDGGAVELLLAFGAVDAWLPQIVGEVDAFFLDGFAPARNPAMWDARLFKAMARLAAADATVATWSAARVVRDGLRGAGFEVEKAPGSAGKRDITRARFAPRFTPRRSPRVAEPAWPMAAPARSGRAAAQVVIVGAGLAGCALARALAEGGCRSLVLERGADIADGGSGNRAGIFHGVVHRGDGRHARFHRAAALMAATAVRDATERDGVRGDVGGVLRLESGIGLAEMRSLLEAQALPADYVEALDAGAASAIAGTTLATPAWHYPNGGWIDPRGLARSWLDRAGAGAVLRLRCNVASLCRVGDAWQVRDGDGAAIATAPTVALCNGDGVLAGTGNAPWPIRRQRGQLSVIAASCLPPAALTRLPIAGEGYVLPPIDDAVWFGAASSWDDDPALRPEDQQRNVERLASLIGLRSPTALRALAGRVGFRFTSDDRLPVIGAVPAPIAAALASGFVAAPTSRFDQPRFIARAPGLFVLAALGSRGIASAAFGAQLLAAAIAGAPSPAEADVLDAVDPARFLSRRYRRDEAARARASVLPGQPPVGPIAGSAGT
jgi:tRNA 5-methylaminomethyl-2-thiouridine biosynthesis bifunctional protein